MKRQAAPDGVFMPRKRKVRKLESVELINPPTIMVPLTPHREPEPEPDPDEEATEEQLLELERLMKLILADKEETLRLTRLRIAEEEEAAQTAQLVAWGRKLEEREFKARTKLLLGSLVQQTQIK